MELVDMTDSKSVAFKSVSVQVRPPNTKIPLTYIVSGIFLSTAFVKNQITDLFIIVYL